MVLRSHYSQFLLFSESSTSSAIPNGVTKFLEKLLIHQDLVEHVDDQKTFPGVCIFSRVFRGIPTSRLGFLELEEIRV